MKMYLISDNVDTLTGMRLAGVEGAVVHEREELKNELDKVLADKSIGIILLTEKFGREFPEIIDDVKLERKLPLIVEIPDRHGTGRKPDFITSYVNEAIGLKLEKYGIRKQVRQLDNRGKAETFPGYMHGGCQGAQRKDAGRLYERPGKSLRGTYR